MHFWNNFIRYAKSRKVGKSNNFGRVISLWTISVELYICWSFMAFDISLCFITFQWVIVMILFKTFFFSIILYCLTRLLTKHLRCPGKQKYGMSLSKFIKFLNELKAFDNKSYNVIHHFNVVKYLPLMITIQNFWGKQNRWYACNRYFIPGDTCTYISFICPLYM